jgi:hypothetical protein
VRHNSTKWLKFAVLQLGSIQAPSELPLQKAPGSCEQGNLRRASYSILPLMAKPCGGVATAGEGSGQPAGLGSNADAKGSSDKLSGQIPGLALVECLLSPVPVIIDTPQSAPAQQKGALEVDDSAELFPTNEPVEDSETRAPRISSFHVTVKKPKPDPVVYDAAVVAAADELLEQARNTGPFAATPALSNLMAFAEEIVVPPPHVQKQFRDRREALCEEIVSKRGNKAPPDMKGWTSESPYKDDEGIVPAKAVIGPYARALQQGSASVMPFITVEGRGVVPDVPACPSLLVEAAQEGCEGDSCLCKAIALFWPKHIRECLRVITHQLILPQKAVMKQVRYHLQRKLNISPTLCFHLPSNSSFLPALLSCSLPSWISPAGTASAHYFISPP